MTCCFLDALTAFSSATPRETLWFAAGGIAFGTAVLICLAGGWAVHVVLFYTWPWYRDLMAEQIALLRLIRKLKKRRDTPLAKDIGFWMLFEEEKDLLLHEKSILAAFPCCGNTPASKQD